MRTLSICAAAGMLASAAFAQVPVPRSSVNLDTGDTPYFDPMVATSGEASVVLYSAGDAALGAAHIYCQRSDGRGLAWSAPVQVDGDGTGARKDIDDPVYVQFGSGSNVYAVWEDLRSGEFEPYFARSTDGGATWDAEIPLDFGFPSGGGALRTDLRMAVAPGSPDRIYVAFASDPLAGNDQLFLVSSLNGGVSFGSAVAVNGTADVDALDIRASGLTVHLAFDDDRLSVGFDDLYYNRSSDGGATFDFGIGTLIAAGNNQERINMTLDGSTVAVSWANEELAAAGEIYRVVVSTNGGTTFGAPVKIGNYTSSTHDVDEPRMMTSGSNLIAVWEDDRTGADNIFVATSTNDGATWTEQPSFGPGGFPRVSNAGSGDEAGVGIVWTGPAVPEDVVGVTSIDHGGTFTPVFTVNSTSGDADFAEIKYNERYNNFISVWMSDDISATNHVYAGGYRPQTLTPVGWGAGSVVVHFDFDLFNPTAPVAWALVNLAGPGTTPLADGRNLGLIVDPLLKTSIQLAVLGLASGPISGSGSGTTPPVPIFLPPGLTFHAVGVSIAGGAAFDITDVVTFGT